MVEVPPEAAIHIAGAADRFNIVLVPHRRDGNEYGIFQKSIFECSGMGRIQR